MEKIITLQGLRKHIQMAVCIGLREIQEKHFMQNGRGDLVDLAGWKETRVVIMGCGQSGIRCCTRKNKRMGNIEIIVLPKNVVPKGGLTDAQWNRVIPRCAAWLEKNNLLYLREKITDITPSMFE